MEHRFSLRELSDFTTRDLIAELRDLTNEHKGERNMFARQALQLRIAAVEHTIARHNARATLKLEGITEDRMLEIERLVRDIGDSPGRDVSTIAELVGEVRRLQGENAKLLAGPHADYGAPFEDEDAASREPFAGPPERLVPRDVPPAAEDFGADAVVPPTPINEMLTGGNDGARLV